MHTPPIILASSSYYRQELLGRLGITFQAISPNINETPRQGELPHVLARRLAQEKAQAIANLHPEAVIIGSDQVASAENRLLGKPGNYAGALEQLQFMQGKTIRFDTGLCVLYKDRCLLDNVPTLCSLKKLSLTQIHAYLSKEPAFDCAGSAKIEALGISLMRCVQSEDPTALIGLPLIRVTDFLQELGIDPLTLDQR